ncbi:protein unc-93 homolog A-like [Ptychodera flava]|uniref:protein unc-93 homolog A-like n=1 Tax=Ptychodera flava TaxID=63121 RepID=UPI00396A3AA2
MSERSDNLKYGDGITVSMKPLFGNAVERGNVAPLAEIEDTDSLMSLDYHEIKKSERKGGEAVRRLAKWRQVWKNTVLLALEYFLLFTAFVGLENLQSTINCVAGLGFVSLTVIYTCMLVSGLFTPPLVIGWLGVKVTIVVAMIPYICFTVANFHPQWYTMIPASALLGFAAPNLWTAQSTYVSAAGRRLSALSGKPVDASINQNLAVFFFIFQANVPIGSLIPSLLYSSTSQTNRSEVYETFRIETHTCGAKDCQETQGNITTFCNPPDKKLTNIMLGVYICLGIAAVAIVLLLVDNFNKQSCPSEVNTQTGSLSRLSATIRLWKNYRMLLLILLSTYNGYVMAIFGGDFTKSYASCLLGVDMVGYVVVCNGISSMVGFCFLSLAGKSLGRVIPMIAALLISLASYSILLVWSSNEWDTIMVFSISALWGIANSALMIENTSIFAITFPNDQEAAFANFYLWLAVGSTIGFSTSLFMCVYIKIVILIILLVLSFTLYFVSEFIIFKMSKDNKKHMNKHEMKATGSTKNDSDI